MKLRTRKFLAGLLSLGLLLQAASPLREMCIRDSLRALHDGQTDVDAVAVEDAGKALGDHDRDAGDVYKRQILY